MVRTPMTRCTIVFAMVCSMMAIATFAAAEDPAPLPQPGNAWSRSLPSRTVDGFPVFVQQAVLAQDADSGVLFSFDMNDGSMMWNTSFEGCGLNAQQLVPLLPHVVDTLQQDQHNRHLIIVQTTTAVIALDLWKGHCVWANTDLYASNPSVPVYRSVLSSDMQFVLVAAPPMSIPNPPQEERPRDTLKNKEESPILKDGNGIHVTGLDVGSGTPMWQHQEDELCNFLPTGSPIPLLVTPRTFFGCFVNPNYAAMKKPHQRQQKNSLLRGEKDHMHQDSNANSRQPGQHQMHGPPAPSIVKEVQLSDNAFHCRVFDFSPRSIYMTSNFQFLSSSTNQFLPPGTQQSENEKSKKTEGVFHPGEADRVGFLISMVDSNTRAFYGPSTLISVIAQAGMVEWSRFLPGTGPVTFAATRMHNAKEIILTDSTTYVLCVATDTGNVRWNTTVSTSLTTSDTPPPTSTVHLGAVDGLSVGNNFIAVTQPCSTSSSIEMDGSQATQEPVKAVTVYPIDGLKEGTVVAQVALTSWNTRRSQLLLSFNGFVYFSTNVDVETIEVATGTVQRLVGTGAPVGALRLDEGNQRALFGTEYSIFCVQTK